MATVVWNSNTLWTDASSGGVGAVQYQEGSLENLDITRSIPRASGSYLKEHGEGSKMLAVVCVKQFANQAGSETFLAACRALIRVSPRVLGSLVVTGHGSVSNVRFVSAEPVAPTSPFQVGSTLYQIQPWFLLFERMR